MQIRLPDGTVQEVEMPPQEQALPQRWAVLVDLDGTLSDHESRLQFLPSEPGGDWTEFYRNQLGDKPFEGVAEIVRRFSDMYVAVLTARPEKYRADTERWLMNNRINWDILMMREEGDHRPNLEVKQEQLAQVISMGWRPFLAFEDHPDTIDYYRGQGIETLAVSNHWEEYGDEREQGNDEVAD